MAQGNYFNFETNFNLLFTSGIINTGLMMKSAIKKILQEKNIYYPLKYSPFFRLYQYIFKPAVIKAEKKEITFYKSFLPASDLVFDIGAYDGHKTAAFLQVAKKVVSVEPDTGSFHVLKTRFRNKQKRVFLENKAASNIIGTGLLHIHHPASAFNTLSGNWKNLLEKDNVEKWDEKIIFTGTQPVPTITFDWLIEKYGVPDFIKIDVEGFEEKALLGLSRRIHFLSFEAMLPEGEEAITNCLAQICKLDPAATFNIGEYERLVFEKFIPEQDLQDWLHLHPPTHFEIIVKMNVTEQSN